jgi:phosphate transport system substrate-binding protein
MRTLTFAALAGIGLAGMVSGCGRCGTASFTVAGSTAFQPFAEKLAEQFMAAHPGVSITVQGGGSAVGIQSAVSGAAQIGMADLPELPPEAKDLTGVVVARDGIAMIVHPANRVAGLTTAQIRGVFDGAITNWKDLGGNDRPVRVVSREAGSGTRTSFEKIVGGIRLVADAIVQDSNGTIRETVANDPDAVGYLSHGLLTDRVRAVPVDGAECSDAHILAGRYRLVRPVFFLTRGAPCGPVRDFVEYVLSAEGQETIRKNGLLPAK